ncbi:hypothetical protein HMPREF1869_00800, partial [Bacteroidales bacterium KA00251]
GQSESVQEPLFLILPRISRCLCAWRNNERACLLLRQKVITTQITQQQNEIYSH